MRALALAVAIFGGCLAAFGEAARVFPSGGEIPENLLRFSISFAAPTAPGVLERLTLRAADGTLIAQPFLEQELWSPDGKTLTLLLHPGRVKSGLRAHDEAGRPLRAGAHVTLNLDGQALKTWRIGPARTEPPYPQCWSVQPPQAGSRDAVVVALNAPIDAQAVGYIAIISARGEKVKGHATLAPGESAWRFTPESGWSEGEYRLLIHPRLEDPQGNALSSRFEQKAGASFSDNAMPAELRFQIGPAAGAQSCGDPEVPSHPTRAADRRERAAPTAIK